MEECRRRSTLRISSRSFACGLLVVPGLRVAVIGGPETADNKGGAKLPETPIHIALSGQNDKLIDG